MKKIRIDHVPLHAGIYSFKDADGNVLYVGKAKSLKKRVSSYFNRYQKDWKVSSLLDEAASVDFIVTKNETEALLLEAQLVQQHKPKFNVLLKEGQPFLYLLFTKGSLPKLELVRTKQKKGTYFGPFLQKSPARSAYRFLMKTFQLQLCNKKLEHGCLDYHIGLCAGNCRPDFSLADYLFRLELAQKTLKNEQKLFIQKVSDEIAISNKNLKFERSKHLHEYLENVDLIFKTIQLRFSEAKFGDDIFAVVTPTSEINTYQDELAAHIQKFLQLPAPVRTIDCFDISHFQSRSIVGSCVRFTDGKPDKNYFRKFNITSLAIQNDYAALQEIVSRRYKESDLPDLILIDGGKGQLNAVKQLFPHASIISLAKREEIVYADTYPDGIKLDIEDPFGKICIALRDYAHHFAISHHRNRQRKMYGK